jgi:hypothetical protein
VSGWNAKGRKGFYEECWKKYTYYFNKLKLPYSIILGNHDAEGDLDRK